MLNSQPHPRKRWTGAESDGVSWLGIRKIEWDRLGSDPTDVGCYEEEDGHAFSRLVAADVSPL
ncbi:MAG TPA: hypothetical protein VMS21_11565 [Methylomirabilota bacterium]|nr:hypothetical protein [Methylomirabilota bacterium]